LGYGALVSVLLTSAKAKADGETVGAILEEGGLSSAQVSAITDKYSVGTPRIPGYHLHPFFATIVDPLLHVTIVQVTECALAGHCLTGIERKFESTVAEDCNRVATHYRH
jgi:hypothetical protein